MGGSKPINLLEDYPDLHQFVVGEDDYIRAQRLKVEPDPVTQALLQPIWRLRSAFNDTMIAMDRGLDHRLLRSQPNQVTSTHTACFSVGSAEKTCCRFQFLLREATIAADLYLVYINRLRLILESARILWKFTAQNRVAVLNSFIEEFRFDPLQAALCEARISFAVEMTEMIMSTLRSSIQSAKTIWDTTMQTVKEIATYFFKHNFPLPTDDLLCRNYLMFYSHQLQHDIVRM